MLREQIRTFSNDEEQVMTIVCDICKKEVHLVRFGDRFVGVCCNKVLCSFADKSHFDMKREEKKDILFTRSTQKVGLIK